MPRSYLLASILVAAFMHQPVSAQQALPVSSIGSCNAKGAIGKWNFDGSGTGYKGVRFTIQSFEMPLRVDPNLNSSFVFISMDGRFLSSEKGVGPELKGTLRTSPYGSGNYSIDISADLSVTDIDDLLSSPAQFTAKVTFRDSKNPRDLSKERIVRTKIDLSSFLPTIRALRDCRPQNSYAFGPQPANRVAAFPKRVDRLVQRNADKLADTGLSAIPAMTIRFQIGTDGLSKGCKAIKSSGSRVADEAMCRIFGREWFAPATDGQGRPLASIVDIAIPEVQIR